MEADIGVSQHLTAFYNKLFEKMSNENIVSSPLSVYTCFALLAEGTQNETLAELRAAFGYGSPPNLLPAAVSNALKAYFGGKNQSVTLKMDNSVYSSTAINPSYIEALRTKYAAHAQQVNFSDPATVSLINTRITEATNGLLKDTISELDPRTVMVLVNTIYFKGKWAAQFNKTDTFKGEFNLSNNIKKQVMYMVNKKAKAAGLSKSGVEYLALPYVGQTVKFVDEMPAKGSLKPSNSAAVLQVANGDLTSYHVFCRSSKRA